VDTIAPFLQFGADAEIHNKDGHTALHVAVIKNNLAAIGKLVANGALVNAVVESTGHTAVHLAAEKENLEAIATLSKVGADMNFKDAVFGMTALHWAAFRGQLSVVAALGEVRFFFSTEIYT
jgi:ankyrin repeat protein